MIKTVIVTQNIKVEIDESKFDQAFMDEFKESIFQFDIIDEHIEHLAQLAARGLIPWNEFIEGYGPAKDMGIKFYYGPIETEIEE